MTDCQVAIAALQRGDPGALDRLVDTYGPGLYRMLAWRVRDRGLAEDLFQEVWQEALRSHHGLRDPSRFHAWLHGIARNLVANALRRKGRRREVSLDDWAATPPPGPNGEAKTQEMVDATAVDPRAAAHTAWLGDKIARMFERLDESTREMFIMRYYQGLSAVEIARTLGAPVGTVYSALHRGLRKMRGHLEREGLTLEDLT